MNILYYISFVALYIGTVTGETKLKPGDAPFFVVIRCNDTNVGNGAIIAKNFVLTSKFIVKNKEECKVVFGTAQFTNNQDASHNTKAISEVIKGDPDEKLENYFALLKVDKPFAFDKNVNSANLIPDKNINTTIGTLYFRSNEEILVSQNVRLVDYLVDDYEYGISKYTGKKELLIAGSPFLIDKQLAKVVITSTEDKHSDLLVNIRQKLKWINAKISATNE